MAIVRVCEFIQSLDLYDGDAAERLSLAHHTRCHKLPVLCFPSTECARSAYSYRTSIFFLHLNTRRLISPVMGVLGSPVAYHATPC